MKMEPQAKNGNRNPSAPPRSSPATIELAPSISGYVIDDAESSIFRVNRKVFVNADLYQLEREKVFSTCWLYLGHASELKASNDFLTRSVGGRPLIFLRDGRGDYRAFINSCRHRGTILCPHKKGNATAFRCPYHAWTYSNEGRLMAVPGADAYSANFDKEEFGLAPAPMLQEYRGFFFVCFNSAQVSLSDYLGEAKYYLDLICDQVPSGWEVIEGSYQHCMQANWKVIADNSTDLYHLPYAHGRYVDFLKSVGTTVEQIRRTGQVKSLGNGHAVAISTPPSGGRPVAYWAPAFPESHKERLTARHDELSERFGKSRAHEMTSTNRGLFIFPNVIFNDNMAVTVRTFSPVAVDEAAISLWGLGPIGEDAVDRKLRLDSLLTFVGPGGFGTPDDVEILESCQRAYASPEIKWNDLSRGMARTEPFHTDELQNRTFWREWLRLLTDCGETT